jgi:mannosyltransferase
MIASYQALSATTKKRLEIFLFPLFLFVLNVIVKFCFLTSRDIALDEPFSIYYAQTDIPSIIQMLYSENNPPFHFFFLHYWVKLFGIGSFSVRLPSLIFSAFTAIVIYKIGKKFFNVVSGFAAALLFTFSTMHIFFSHEARVYPLFVMLTALSLYYYLSIIKTPENKTFYYLLFICNLLLIYSHYFGFFVLFVEVISLLFLPNTKAFIKPYFMMFVALGLSYIYSSSGTASVLQLKTEHGWQHLLLQNIMVTSIALLITATTWWLFC